MKKSNIIIVFIFFISHFVSLAQEIVDSIPPLPSDELEVIKDFKARLATSNAMTWEYQPLEWKPNKLKYNYDVVIRNLDLEYLPPLMRPLTLYPEPPKKTYKSSILGAYGFPKAWKGHLIFANSWDDKNQLGVRYLTYGYNHSKEDSLLQANNHDATINFASKLTSRVKIKTDFNYLRDSRNFRDDLGMSYSRIHEGVGGMVGFDSPIEEDFDFNYFINVGYDRTTLNTIDLSENILSLKAGVQYDWEFLSLAMRSNFKQIIDDILPTQNYINNSLLLSYTRGRHYLAIGGHHFYTKNENNKVLPTFNVTYNLFDTEHFIELQGKTLISINNYQQLFKWNPFIQSIGNQRELYYSQEYTLGFRGAIGNINYRFEGGYADLYNTPTAQLSPSDKINHTLSLDYIDGSSILFRTHLTYSFTDDSNINIVAAWASLDTKNSDEFYSEWYNTSIKLSSTFSLLDNALLLKPGFALIEGLKEHSDSDSRLVHDLYCDIYYKFSKHFSLYLNASNLLNNQESRWANRPQLGTSVLIGLKAKF